MQKKSSQTIKPLSGKILEQKTAVMPDAKKIFIILIALLLLSALINNEYFESSSMAAYFFYVITAGIICLFGSIVYFIYGKTVKIANIFPVALLALLTSYYFIQYILTSRPGLNSLYIFLLANCLLLISFCILFELFRPSKAVIYKIVTCLAVAEAFLCFLQSGGLIKSSNPLFAVSGTWVNPNVTAMFLAMAAPATLSLYYQSKSSFRKFYLFLLTLLIGALLLLKCRTAFIGTTIAVLIVVNQTTGLLQKARHRFKGIKMVLPLLLLVIIASALFYFLYYAKQESSEGRKLIWKISAGMIARKPLTGYGLGQFEYNYNLQQAGYFSKKTASNSEIKNASYTSMAYNEFLQNAVEGGLIGLAIFAFFFISLVIPFPGAGDIHVMAAYAAVLSFAVMSVFNFTFQAIPAMGLFILYASLISVNVKTKFRPVVLLRRIPSCCLLLFTGVCLCITQTQLAGASSKSKRASLLIKRGESDLAISLLAPLEKKLKLSEPYWTNYGNALLKKKDYTGALDRFKRAVVLKAYPATYIQMAVCYKRLEKPDSAIAVCTLAGNLAPNRLTPFFVMMMIYHDQKDRNNEISMANKIITMTPKVPSKETELYKKTANKLLKSDNQTE